MAGPDAAEIRRVLSKRADCLDYLLHEPRRKPDIQSHLDVSRSTVDYAVRELLEAGLAERTPEGFRATTFGQLAYGASATYDRMLRGQSEAFDAVTALPPDSPIEPLLFDGADVVLPEPNALDRPLRRFLDLVYEADRFRGFSPVVLASYTDVFYDRIVDDGMPMEVVVTEGVLTHFTTTYAERFFEVLDTERVTVYEAPEDLPFGLALAEREAGPYVGLLVYDETGVRGFVGNDSDAAVGWAERLYRRYRDEAEAVFTRSNRMASP